MKKIMLSLLVFLFMFASLSPISTSAAPQLQPIGIIIDGAKLDEKGILWDGGFVYVPARVVLEKLGVQFSYDAKTRTLKATSPLSFSITADQEIGSLNNKPILLEVPPKIINNTFMISTNSIRHLFNYSAAYNSDLQSATISTASSGSNSFDPYATYNQRVLDTAEFMKVGKAFMGKTNWIIGRVIAEDLSGNPYVPSHLSTIWIEKVDKDEMGKVKLLVKSGDKKFVIRYVTATSIFDQLTFVNPFEANKWSPAIWEQIKQRKISVGMNTEMVQLAIGKPIRFNSSTTATGTFDQWVYETRTSTRYVYFKNNIVTSIQESKR